MPRKPYTVYISRYAKSKLDEIFIYYFCKKKKTFSEIINESLLFFYDENFSKNKEQLKETKW